MHQCNEFVTADQTFSPPHRLMVLAFHLLIPRWGLSTTASTSTTIPPQLRPLNIPTITKSSFSERFYPFHLHPCTAFLWISACGYAMLLATWDFLPPALCVVATSRPFLNSHNATCFWWLLSVVAMPSRYCLNIPGVHLSPVVCGFWAPLRPLALAGGWGDGVNWHPSEGKYFV